MGTRGDFYIGRGKDAKWLGSVAYDAHPENPQYKAIGLAATAKEFRAAVARELANRNDSTLPKDGWPWPWDNSCTTDVAFAYERGVVYVSWFGRGWDPYRDYVKDFNRRQRAYKIGKDVPEPPERPKVTFPDMSHVKNITFGPRSGILLFSAKALP